MSVPSPESRLELLTHPEVAALDRDRAVAVIPAGAIEQHGPHLPLDTDAFLAAQVARAAGQSALAQGPVIVTPPLCFGSSEHHMDFPGTLTVSPETFAGAVRDISRSLARHGFRRQLILNGHGGNSALLAAVVQQEGFQSPCLLATIDYWMLAEPTASALRESELGGMGHACEFETSLMLHLRPDSVRTEAIQREIPRPRYTGESFDLLSPGPLRAHWEMHELSRSGVMGAPDLAAADKGKRIFEACVESLVRLIGELRAAPLAAPR